jgi:TrmH family RNA methyltransferase
MPEKITSGSNPRIRRLVELRKKAKLRRETGLFVIEGGRLCADTPERFISEVYVTEGWLKSAPEKEAAAFRDRPYTLVTEEVMAKASDTETPQGILCVARMPSYSFEELLKTKESFQEESLRKDSFRKESFQKDSFRKDSFRDDPQQKAPQKKNMPQGAPLLLVLEDIQDPGNLGTIFRTAEAAGVSGILMSRTTVDLFNPKVVRATMSAVFRMPFVIREDLCADLAVLRRAGIRSYAAHLDGKRAYDEVPMNRGCALLIGNEGNGLSERLTEAADEKIIIPMQGDVESLNAAMAAGILLFEAARQRRHFKTFLRQS